MVLGAYINVIHTMIVWTIVELSFTPLVLREELRICFVCDSRQCRALPLYTMIIWTIVCEKSVHSKVTKSVKVILLLFKLLILVCYFWCKK
jgi:hypothetical protein